MSSGMGTASYDGEGRDGSCGLSSVLCRLFSDIVKRVVTVKRASAAGGGWGLGMGMPTPRREPWRLAPWLQRPGHRQQRAEPVSRPLRGWIAPRRLVCGLSSVLCQARGFAAGLGLGVGELEGRASGECLGTERR
jgi:hypothetical protein